MIFLCVLHRKTYFSLGFLQLLHHVMASEIQDVNCQELHNPTSTPRVVSTQSDVSSDAQSKQLEVLSVPDIEPAAFPIVLPLSTEALIDPILHLELVPEEQSDASASRQSEQCGTTTVPYIEPTSPLRILAPPREVCSTAASRMEDIPNEQSTAFRRASPVILASPTEVLQAHALLRGSPSEVLGPASRSGGHYGDSTPVVEAEHEAVAHGPESILKHGEPSVSDQDDDVQFILSVTKKKRKKKIRQALLPGDQGKDASIHVGKDPPNNTSNHANQSASLDLQNAGLKLTAAQNLPHPYPGLQSAHDYTSFPSAAPGSLITTNPSSPTSTPKTQKPTTRKRKRGQDNNLTATPKMLSNTQASNTSVSMETPIIYQFQQSPQRFFPARPLLNVQYMPGMNPVGTGQPISGFGAYSLPLSLGLQSQQTNANGVQSHMHSQGGHAATTNQTLLISASMSESLRRRPSLYTVPQWQPAQPSTGMTLQPMSESAARSMYQSTYGSKNGILPGVPHTMLSIAAPENVLPFGNGPQSSIPSRPVNSQLLNLQQSATPSTGSQSSQPAKSQPAHPPNMLVDIAQTCQDTFPFALIAKRHNQPIQKVFDTFSAAIQLPLLRSVVDARRPGKLGSLRMKEFRAMKKNVKEGQKGKQGGNKAEKIAGENGIGKN